jgi:hypothetical protein
MIEIRTKKENNPYRIKKKNSKKLRKDIQEGT